MSALNLMPTMGLTATIVGSGEYPKTEDETDEIVLKQLNERGEESLISLSVGEAQQLRNWLSVYIPEE